MLNIILSAAVQVGIVVWGLSACHKKAESSFWDNESTNVIRGIFSILIVLFHVPVSNLLYNLLGCCTFVLIVTLFSLFSAYGIVIKASVDSTYIARLPKRIVRITCCYLVTLAIKSLVTENVLGGGISWLNTLILSYAVFYISYMLCGKYKNAVIVIFWICYWVVTHLFPNSLFGWGEQSLGFAYGVLLAVYREQIKAFLEKNTCIKTGGSLFGILITGIIYVKVRNPAIVTLETGILRIIMTLFMLLIFYSVSLKIELRGKTLTYLGHISLYIFLFHGLVIDILKVYMADGLLIVFSIAGTIICAIIFDCIVGGLGNMQRDKRNHK